MNNINVPEDFSNCFNVDIYKPILSDNLINFKVLNPYYYDKFFFTKIGLSLGNVFCMCFEYSLIKHINRFRRQRLIFKCEHLCFPTITLPHSSMIMRNTEWGQEG
jgi:hypothetical protein